MAIHDLSLVTQSLVRLVDAAVRASPVRPMTPTGPVDVDVTSLPPDLLLEDNMIGIYLYHVVEEAAHKNQPWPHRPGTPIRFTPLGLNLHYLVTAHSTVTTEAIGPYREQLLLGIALKALHDHPIVDDLTEIAGTKAFPLEMQGGDNRFRLALRHIPANEAVSYWTAGSQPLRLSAYYEVSVVLVEPEEPARGSGRVFTWGVHSFVGGLPRLTSSRSTVVVPIPTAPAPRRIDVQPAQAAIGDEVTLIGSGLGRGAFEVLLRGPGLDPARAVGPGWAVNGAGDEVFLTVQGTLDGDPAQPIAPGTYAATVAVTRTTTLADGRPHAQTLTTNETPFQIVPRAVPGPVAPATGRFTVTGGRFIAPVRASIAGGALALVTTPLQAGEFRVVSETELELALPPGAPSGEPLPVRVIVNGCESPPMWVTVP